MTTVRWCHWPGTSLLEQRNLSDVGKEVGVQTSGSNTSKTPIPEKYEHLKSQKSKNQKQKTKQNLIIL